MNLIKRLKKCLNMNNNFQNKQKVYSSVLINKNKKNKKLNRKFLNMTDK